MTQGRPRQRNVRRRDEQQVVGLRRGPTGEVRGLLPLAAALVVVGGLAWWLLDRGSPLAPWLVAAVLVAHGWVHLVFLVPTPGRPPADVDADVGADNPFDMSRSWLLARGCDRRLIRLSGAALALVTCVAFAASALAVLGWLLPAAWWGGLATVGVVGSTVLLVLFFAPALVLGFLINACLLALAFQTAWQVHR
jgi:hypothetical protein